MPDQVSGILSPFLRRRRMANAQRYVRGKTLDYGCGVGMFSKFVPASQYVGIDSDPHSISVARSDNPDHIFLLNEDDAQLKQYGPYDTILALAVIEHIPDRSGLLYHFKGLLSSSGTIVLTTPHPVSQTAHLMGSRIRLFSKEAEDEHGELIDRNQMELLLTKAELKIEIYKKFLFGMNQLFVIRSM